MKKTVWLLLMCAFFLCVPGAFPGAAASDEAGDQGKLYREYKSRFDRITAREQIDQNGFSAIEDQIFTVDTMTFQTVTIIPAMDRRYSRLALFAVGEDGAVVYKTDQLETNNRNKGMLKQQNRKIAAISFQDVDGDGLTDIVLITVCQNDGGHIYKVGDVLFQNKTGFYRDWRLSDKLNRYSMNKSVLFITSFVKDGYSTEFLYTATTLKELLAHGFLVDGAKSRFVEFEKMGRLKIVPGTYKMAEYTVFMIYLVNEEGYIVWSFQPMGDYENLFEVKGIVSEDINGDGLKDLAVLASYTQEEIPGEITAVSDYSIYYQRTGGFYADTEYKKGHPCGEEDTLEVLLEHARAYWGWKK